MFIVMLQFYSPSPAPDMHEMAAALRGWGHRVLVGTPDQHGDLCFDEAGLEVARIVGARPAAGSPGRLLPGFFNRLAQLAFMFRVRAALSALRPDIVQVNPTMFAFLLPVLQCKQSRYLLDVRQAGEVAGKDLLGRFRNWRIVMKHRINARLFYHHACFASEAAAERILGSRWARWATIHRVGQDVTFLTHAWREVAQLKSGEPVRFVYIGTISKVRQLELLLDAIRHVTTERQDFLVDFIGPDAADGYYQRLVEQWGLDPIVRFLPSIPYHKVAGTVATYDVALAYVPPLPDWQYQPTLKVLEYRALGIPVLASDNAATRDVIGEGINGLLVSHTRGGIASGLMRFIVDRDYLRQVSDSARRNRHGRTWADAAKEYVESAYLPLLQANERLACK
jgi:glycosyltransferase involved in cell wall biosynthesis